MKIKTFLICGTTLLGAYLSIQPVAAQTMNKVETVKQLTGLTQSANKALQEIKTPSSIEVRDAEQKVVNLGVQGSLVIDEINNVSQPPLSPRPLKRK